MTGMAIPFDADAVEMTMAALAVAQCVNVNIDVLRELQRKTPGPAGAALSEIIRDWEGWQHAAQAWAAKLRD